MNRLKITLVITMLTGIISFAQVGIANENPDSSALLEIGDGTDNTGILIPRVALTAANVAAPVTNPAHSLLIYNTATDLSPAGYINDVRPGFYSWDSNKNMWITQTKENRTAKWTSTNTTEDFNDGFMHKANIFGTEVFNDDPDLYQVTPSNTADDLLITEAGRYEIRVTMGIEVDYDDRYQEIVIKTDLRLDNGGVITFPSVTVYGYINDDGDIERGHIQIFDTIEVQDNTEVSVAVLRETDSGLVTLESVGAAYFSIRKIQ